MIKQLRLVLSALLLTVCVGLSAQSYSDVTNTYLKNANLSSLDGWTESHTTATYVYDPALSVPTTEYYQKWGTSGEALDKDYTFSLKQTVTLPAGKYKLVWSGFYREGNIAGNNTKAYFYAGENQKLFTSVVSTWMDDAGVTSFSGNDMAKAAAAFANGYAAEELEFEVAAEGEIEIGYTGVINTYQSWCAVAGAKLYKWVDAYTGFAQALANAQAIKEEHISAATKTALEEAIATYSTLTETSEVAELEAATEALNAAIAAAETSKTFFTANKAAYEGMKTLLSNYNVYTAEAYEAYYAKVKAYEDGTLTANLTNPYNGYGWHTLGLDFYSFLLSAWTIGGVTANEFDAPLYINTWSVEGNTDGTEFKVPFYEYFVNAPATLGATDITANVKVEANKQYVVTVVARVQNGTENNTEGKGITLQVGEGTAVDVTKGTYNAGSKLFCGEFKAFGSSDAEGNLKISFTIAEDNNIHWFTFQNVKYEEMTKSEAQIKLETTLATAAAIDMDMLRADIKTQLETLIAEANTALSTADDTVMEAANTALTDYLPVAQASEKAHEILAAGGPADGDMYGWASTEPKGDLHANTWSTEADGTGMVKPFIENWVNANVNPTLGDGVITYTLEGLEPGYYMASALVRVYSETGVQPTEGLIMSVNDNLKYDIIPMCNTVSYNTLKGVYGIDINNIGKVEEDGKLVVSYTLKSPVYNWVSFKKMQIVQVDEATYNEFAAALIEYQTIMFTAALEKYKPFTEYGEYNDQYNAIKEKCDNFAYTSVEEIEADQALLESLWDAYCLENASYEYPCDVTDVIKNAHCQANGDAWAGGGRAEMKGQHWNGNASTVYFGQNHEDYPARKQTITIPYTGRYTLDAILRVVNENSYVKIAIGTDTLVYTDITGNTGGTIATDGTEWTDVETGIAAGKTFANGNAGYGWIKRTLNFEATAGDELVVSIDLSNKNAGREANVAGLTLNYCGEEKIADATLNPASGSEVEETLESFTITYNAAETLEVNAECPARIQMLDADGNIAGSFNANYAIEGNVVTVTRLQFGASVAPFMGMTPGTYTIVIPENQFKMHKAGDTYPERKVIAGKVEFTYTIKPYEWKVAEWTITPENGSEVESLDKVKFTATDLESIGVENYSATITVTKDGADYKTVTADKIGYEADYAYNELHIELDLTEAGVYEITLPAGTLNGNDGAYKSPEIKFNYTIVAPAVPETVVADPESGSIVESTLDAIKITFPEATSVAVAEDNYDPISFVDATGNIVGAIRPNNQTYTIEGNTVTLTWTMMGNQLPFFAEFGAGEYTLQFPAGKFVKDGTTATGAFELTYVVEEAEVAVNYEVNPADGSTVESLDVITVTFPDFMGANQNSDGVAREIVIKKDGAAYKTLGYGAIGFGEAWNALDITLGLTEEGTYTIEIPEGMIGGEDAAYMFHAASAITLTYTIAKPIKYVVDPESGSTHESLETINIAFPDFEYGEQNPDGAAREIVIKKDGADYKTLDYGAIAFGTTNNSLDITLGLTEEGTYTIEIPAGMIGGMDAEYNFYGAPAITLTYTIGVDTGINGINAENVLKTEYINVNGIVTSEPVKGLNVVKQTLKDGKVVMTKMYVK